MEVLRFQIAAGETKVFVKAGGYFEVLATSYPITARFYDQAGGESDDAVNVESGFYASLPYTQLTIYSASAQAVELLIARREAGSKRLPGVVLVMDAGAYTTRGGGAFTGTLNTTGNAGQFGGLQVYNPITSGKRVVIERVEASAAAGVSWAAGMTSYGAQWGNAQGGLHNKLSGAAESTAYWLQKTDHATDPASTIVQLMASAVMGAAGEYRIQPMRPYIVMPGYGFVLVCRTAAAAIKADFDLYEEVL